MQNTTVNFILPLSNEKATIVTKNTDVTNKELIEVDLNYEKLLEILKEFKVEKSLVDESIKTIIEPPKELVTNLDDTPLDDIKIEELFKKFKYLFYFGTSVEIANAQNDIISLNPKYQLEINKFIIKQNLNSIRQKSQWGNKQEVIKLKKSLLELDPTLEDIINKKINEGLVNKQISKEFESKLNQLHSGKEKKELFKKYSLKYPNLISKFNKSLNFSKHSSSKYTAFVKALKSGKSLSNIVAKFDYQIQNLKPSKKWTLLIDETGQKFSNEDEGLLGKFVALLVPDNTKLKPISTNFHSCNETDKTLDTTLQELLNQNDIGILGLRFDDLIETKGEQWIDGILELINWVIRLIPLNGNTDIDILIEQRGSFNSAVEWNDISKKLIEMELSKINVERSKNINLNINFIPKTGHEFLAYVDLIAYSWGSSNQVSKLRLKQSKLAKSCLYEKLNTKYRNIYDNILKNNAPLAAEWAELIASKPSGNIPNNIITTMLDKIKEFCAKDINLWENYLEYVTLSLDEKDIKLEQIGKEIIFLDSTAPNNYQFQKKLRFAFLMAKLAEHNHIGISNEIKLESELATLSKELFYEIPHITCLADLNRAVAKTNCFDFDSAYNIVKKWEDRPIEVPGLQMAARALSSIGQHKAFLGDNITAIKYFDNAVKHFNDLSNKETAEAEIAHSLTYKAITLMDLEVVDNKQVTDVICKIVGSDINTALKNMSKTTNKYHHHLLIRYLIICGSSAEKEIYINNKKLWNIEDYGHPWQLIKLYQAILIKNNKKEDAINLALEAYTLTLSDGATVKLIGLVCRAIAYKWGATIWYSKKAIDEVLFELPKAKERISYIISFIENPNKYSEIELLNNVLPFNFH